VQRQIERQHRVRIVTAQYLGAPRGGLLEAGPRRFQVGDHHRPRHSDGGALVPHHAGGAADALAVLRGRDNEKGRVRCPQTGPEFPDEVRIAGGVQQIDLETAPFHRDERQLYGPLLPLFDLVVVGYRAAVLHPARPVHRSGGQRERLHQCRLARSTVADQHHVAHCVGAVGRRCPSGGPWLYVFPVGCTTHESRLPVRHRTGVFRPSHGSQVASIRRTSAGRLPVGCPWCSGGVRVISGSPGVTCGRPARCHPRPERAGWLRWAIRRLIRRRIRTIRQILRSTDPSGRPC